VVVSDKSYEDEGYEKEEDALGELMEQVKELSTKIEKLEVESACFSFEGDAQDISVLQIDVLGIPTYDEEFLPDMVDDSANDFTTIKVSYSSHDVLAISYLEEEIVEEEDQDIAPFSQ
jgi:hypothetical protein